MTVVTKVEVRKKSCSQHPKDHIFVEWKKCDNKMNLCGNLGKVCNRLVELPSRAKLKVTLTWQKDRG